MSSNPSSSSQDRTELSLVALSWPVFIENVLRMTLATVDVFMLSFYSEKAVAAMGLVSQFIFFTQIVYMMVTIGTSILIAQNLGAQKIKEANDIALGSMVLSLVFSVVLSLVVVAFADPILSAYSLEPEVHRYAYDFLVVFGAGSVFMAMNMIQGTIIRSFGYSKEPMYVAIVANVLNVIGNSLFLFGFFGIPVLGTTGVAISMVFSQFVAMVILYFRMKRRKEIHLPYRQAHRIEFSVYKKILGVGVPTAGENLSYNIGQIVILSMIAKMGTNALNAYIYAITCLRYVFMTSISIGVGTQLKVGYYVGSGKFDEAYKKAYRYFFTGFGISLVLALALFAFQTPIMTIFTKNPEVLALIASILLVGIVLEPGRNFNIIVIPALKGAGDIKFPVYVGMVFMWGIGVLGAYVLGVGFGLGLMGIWIAMACDEWIRGLIMIFRWKSGKWRSMALVKKSEPVASGELPGESTS